MPTDITIPFAYDSTDDVATVTGTDFYEQHALQLAAIAQFDTAGSPLTANDVTEITSRLRRVYTDSPYFETPISVRATDVSGTTITVAVRLGNGTEFSIPVDTRDSTVQ
jgi:outer membrane protein assembly factor BamA